MNEFPQELVDNICRRLSAEDLRNVYYVSKRFRKAAEEYAGQHKTRKWDMTDEIIAHKQTSIDFYSGFWFRYLKEVEFYPSLPYYSTGKKYNCRVSAAEQQEQDKIFTDQIRDLFARLKKVEDRAGEGNRGQYRLTIYAPLQDFSGEEVDCLHREHAQWRTHLVEPSVLPCLMSVISLHIEDGYDIFAKLDYRILIDLATRFPNLQELKCRIGNDEWTPFYDEDGSANLFPWEYDGPRRDTRHDFGGAITTAHVPETLLQVELDFLCRRTMSNAEGIDQMKSMPNLVSPACRDPFSTSLRILSYHLVELTLRAQVDETLFWPHDGATPTWPHLRRLFIMFHMVSPSGAWYFEGPRGEGRDLMGYELDESSYPPRENTEEEDRYPECVEAWDRSFETLYSYWFRISPNERLLVPFLTSFAKAAANMPELRQAVLWSPLQWDVDGGNYDERFDYYEPPEHFYPESIAWGLAYNAPRLPLHDTFSTTPGEANCKERQIWWKIAEWRPDAELHGLFQKIGFEKHGESLKEYWNDDKWGQELVPRWEFQDYTPEE